MREVKAAELEPISSLPAAILHKSGTVLLEKGESLTAPLISLLQEKKLEAVFLAEPHEPVPMLRRQLTYAPLKPKELQAGEIVSRSIYDLKGHLLLEKGACIPKNFASSLLHRGMDTIYFRRPGKELDAGAARELRQEIVRLQKKKKRRQPEGIDKRAVEKFEEIKLEQAPPEDLSAKTFRKKIDRLREIEVKPEGEAFAEQVRDTRQADPASAAEKQSFSDVVQKGVDNMREVYHNLACGNNQIAGISAVFFVDEIASQAMAGVIRHRELLMLCSMSKQSDEYLASHAVAMTALAVNIGVKMGYGANQIKSLAYGALLKNVGLLKIPRDILSKIGPLTERERAEIRRHPVLGLDLLQAIGGIPAEVPYIVYQSHERANGSGYPCGKKDVVIHAFARIVGVADIYAAMCSERPYREAKTPYEAMEQLVFMCGKKLLNPEVLRAFLNCNSLFPVGSFAQLSDGKIGRIIAANAEDYTRPVICLLWDVQLKPLPQPERINLLSDRSLSIKQALKAENMPVGADEMIGF